MILRVRVRVRIRVRVECRGVGPCGSEHVMWRCWWTLWLRTRNVEVLDPVAQNT